MLTDHEKLAEFDRDGEVDFGTQSRASRASG